MSQAKYYIMYKVQTLNLINYTRVLSYIHFYKNWSSLFLFVSVPKETKLIIFKNNEIDFDNSIIIPKTTVNKTLIYLKEFFTHNLRT